MIMNSKGVMIGVQTCTATRDGWQLYNYLLSDRLAHISAHSTSSREIWTPDTAHDPVENLRCEQVIQNTQAVLVGTLYMIMKRMEINGHVEDTIKMRWLIEMVAGMHITDPRLSEDIRAIEAKHDKLNPFKSEFDQEYMELTADM